MSLDRIQDVLVPPSEVTHTAVTTLLATFPFCEFPRERFAVALLAVIERVGRYLEELDQRKELPNSVLLSEKRERAIVPATGSR